MNDVFDGRFWEEHFRTVFARQISYFCTAVEARLLPTESPRRPTWPLSDIVCPSCGGKPPSEWRGRRMTRERSRNRTADALVKAGVEQGGWRIRRAKDGQ